MTYKITKHSNFLYSLQASPILLNCILKCHIFDMAYLHKNELFFHCETLQELTKSQDILSHHVSFIDNLSLQMSYLKTKGYGFIGFNTSDVLVVDNCIFIFVNDTYLQKIDENDFFTFLCPFKKPEFISPELNQLTNLPGKIHYKTCYYSLGCLLLSCLGFDSLDSVYYSKLYWFFKKCLETDVELRKWIYI